MTIYLYVNSFIASYLDNFPGLYVFYILASRFPISFFFLSFSLFFFALSHSPPTFPWYRFTDHKKQALSSFLWNVVSSMDSASHIAISMSITIINGHSS